MRRCSGRTDGIGCEGVIYCYDTILMIDGRGTIDCLMMVGVALVLVDLPMIGWISRQIVASVCPSEL